MNIEITTDYNELSIKAAKKVADYINSNPNKLVCFAAGNTPLGMLRELVTIQDRGEVDLSTVYYAALDEWVGLGLDDAGSCVKVMTDVFYQPAGIPKKMIHLFNGLDKNTDRQCREMERWLSSHGGIGFTLLGIGMNGHIGLNEPGTPETEGCLSVPLADITKLVSFKYFGRELPITTGITIGLRTLLGACTVVLLASGSAKAPIIKSSLQGPITLSVPASLFQKHENIFAMLDKKAASLLERL